MAASSLDESNGSARQLPAGRKADLVAHVHEVGQVTVSALADRFGVSLDTIRRDLDQLDADGVLIRTHGGALSPSALPRPDTGFEVRRRVQISAKERIGALAAGLVEDGSTLMINGGTTTLAVVRHLRDKSDLTIATNGLQIPAEVSPKAVRDLYVFGGPVRLSAQATVGPVAFPTQTSGGELDIQCDLALIAVGAVSVEHGYTTSNLGEATVMASMMERSAKLGIVADSSKFDRRLFAQIAELGRPDYFITDTMPPTGLREALERAEVQILAPRD